jgi:glycosyltransferase involved in cell wall biosynthesis
MNILEVVEGTRATGSAAAALASARALRARGHRVTWLCRKGSGLAADGREAGLEVREELQLSIPALFPAARKIADLAAEADLVHVHRSKGHLAALMGLGFSKRSTPLARTCHAGRPGETGAWARWLVGKAEVLVVRSAEQAFDLGATASSQGARLAVIPGGVDAEVFHPGVDGSVIRTDLELSDQVVVGTASHLKPGRRLFEFCTAAGKLCADEALQNVSFLILGRGKLGKSLVAWITRAGLTERIKVFDPRKRFVQALAALDVGVMLMPGSDGSARTALELAALGKPLVLGDIGALSDLAGIEGECARRVAPASADEIAAAISELVRDDALRTRLGAAARARFEGRHSLERLGENYEKLFRSLLQAKTGTKAKETA